MMELLTTSGYMPGGFVTSIADGPESSFSSDLSGSSESSILNGSALINQTREKTLTDWQEESPPWYH
jgi:hypothetical protein